MRILVVGAGATGGYFGGRLARAGRDVTFLVRPSRAERLRATGLQILSPTGDVSITPKVVTTEALADAGPFDVVIVSVKAFSLDQALDDLAPAVGADTMIVPLLNGLRHFDTLSRRFGNRAVLGGLCRINTTVDDLGRIVHFSPLHELWYGERDGSRSSRVLRLDQAFRDAGFDAHLSESIEEKLWEKWTLLATIGGITCLMRGNLGEVARAPGGTEFSLRLFGEVLAVVEATGRRPSDAFVTEIQGWLAQKDSIQATSMYRDMTKGNPVEADQILGDLGLRAKRAGVPTPLLDAAYTNLCLYQVRRDASHG